MVDNIASLIFPELHILIPIFLYQKLWQHRTLTIFDAQVHEASKIRFAKYKNVKIANIFCDHRQSDI